MFQVCNDYQKRQGGISSLQVCSMLAADAKRAKAFSAAGNVSK